MDTPREAILFRQSSLTLAAICLLMCGCGGSDDAGVRGKTSQSYAPNSTEQSAVPGATVSADTKPENTWPSDVKVSLPDLQVGTTHALRAEGACNLPVHDRQHPFEFELQGRASYRVRISQGPFADEHWHINPLVDVTNDSGSRLYVGYYAAFFNKAGRVVGCCGQQVDSEPSARPHQLGSLVIYGPQAKLLTATHFKIVIYESDKRIGAEPISAESTRTLVGRSGKVISKLEQIDASAAPNSDHRELRLQARLAFEDPVEKIRNTHLQIQGAAKYDIYLSTRTVPRTMQTLDQDGQKLKEPESFDSWEAEVEFEQRPRVKGVSRIVHAVLLDESGRLIACSSTNHNRRLAAPEDKLLSGNRLDLVVYESGGSMQSAAPKVTPKPPTVVVNPNPATPNVPAETARTQPSKAPTAEKTTKGTSPIKSVPEIDRPNDKGFAQLHTAAMLGKIDVTKNLLAAGANINVPQQKYQGTPLQYAAARGHLEVMKLLLKAGATVDSTDSLKRTPLWWAVKERQPKASRLLLESGADPFDRAVQSIVDQLRTTNNKDVFETFEDYFAKQTSTEWLRWQAASLTISVELEGKALVLERTSEPALRYPANATGDNLQGRLDVWTIEQIPFAVSSHQIQEKGKLFRSLALLREAPVKAVQGNETIWQPARRDHAWSPVPNAEPVSETADQRIKQMTTIAQRFSMAGRTLRPDPILRYVNDLSGFKVADAGVFVFLKNATPHALLTVEAYGDQAQWRYTLTRLTAPPASIQLDGKTVFEWPGYWASPRDAGDDFAEQPSITRRR